jgi:hypothetical protein
VPISASGRSSAATVGLLVSTVLVACSSSVDVAGGTGAVDGTGTSFGPASSGVAGASAYRPRISGESVVIL